jgi:hypothetical protein
MSALCQERTCCRQSECYVAHLSNYLVHFDNGSDMLAGHIFRIAICYIAGILAGSLILGSFSGLPGLGMALVFAFGGAIEGLPILFVAAVLFLVLNKSVMQNLTVWCLAVPLMTLVLYLALLWVLEYSNRGRDLYWFLSLQHVWVRATLASFFASLSSGLFWSWNRYYPR